MGIPVSRMFGLDPAKCPISTFTIGIDTPERIRMKVREAEQYPALKIKLGTDDDRAILTAIRESRDKELRVDANCRVDPEAGDRDAPGARRVRGDGAGAAARPGRHRRTGRGHPARADSGDRRRELPHRGRYPRLVGKVDGINIKLAKSAACARRSG